MAERPVECSHCKKEIQATYKEILGHQTSCTEMCKECPILAQKLHGSNCSPVSSGIAIQEEASHLACANCMTTLEGIKTGNPVGCSCCYLVFEEALLKELLIDKNNPSSLHVGKAPHKSITFSSSTQIPTLNEALNEALKKENYEQAAWLRDQIKELMEGSSE